MEIPDRPYLKRILRSLGVETLPPLNEHLTNLERVKPESEPMTQLRLLGETGCRPAASARPRIPSIR